MCFFVLLGFNLDSNIAGKKRIAKCKLQAETGCDNKASCTNTHTSVRTHFDLKVFVSLKTGTIYNRYAYTVNYWLWLHRETARLSFTDDFHHFFLAGLFLVECVWWFRWRPTHNMRDYLSFFARNHSNDKM